MIKNFIFIICLFGCNQNFSQVKSSITSRFPSYVENGKFYSETDSTQTYCFRLVVNNKGEIQNFTTFYFSKSGEVVNLSDDVAFKNSKVDDMKKFENGEKYTAYIQPFIVKRVEAVKDYKNAYHFSTTHIEKSIQLISAANEQQKGRSYILKPLIVFRLEYD